MRKIEQQMIAALRAGKSRTIGNTYVNPCIGFVEVQLHGNIIARVDLARGEMSFTLAGWPTPTTRRRVNALLREFVHANAYVYQENGLQWFSGIGAEEPRVILSTEWVQT